MTPRVTTADELVEYIKNHPQTVSKGDRAKYGFGKSWILGDVTVKEGWNNAEQLLWTKITISSRLATLKMSYGWDGHSHEVLALAKQCLFIPTWYR